MKRAIPALAVCFLLVGVPAGLAAARTTHSLKLRAHLTATGKGSTGFGSFTGTLLRYRNGQSMLSWNLTYRSLRRRATRAGVQIPATKKGQSRIYVLLCRPCRPSSHSVIRPIYKASTTALLTRPAYIVVATKKRPAGAIRGRLIRSR